jgi:ABC-2 type transport system ATP-binding protein
MEYLEFFAAAYRLRGPARRQKCEEVLQLVELGYKRDALVTSLSRGMTQRLGLARVLLHDPQVLLLDEPASGLDPRARIEIRQLLKQLRQMGKTIMVSSHILPELADICNKVGIIERGVLLISAEVSEVIRRVREHLVVRIRVGNNPDEAARLLEQEPTVQQVDLRDGAILATLRTGVEDYSPLAALLVQAGYHLLEFRQDELNLESAFMALTKGITA